MQTNQTYHTEQLWNGFNQAKKQNQTLTEENEILKATCQKENQSLRNENKELRDEIKKIQDKFQEGKQELRNENERLVKQVQKLEDENRELRIQAARDEGEDKNRHEVVQEHNEEPLRSESELFFEKLKLQIERDINQEAVIYIWKIDDFQTHLNKLQIDYKHRVISEQYSSGDKGYQFRLFIKQSTDLYYGTKYIEIYFQNVQGIYDNILAWPFKSYTKITVLNQNQYYDMTKKKHTVFHKPVIFEGNCGCFPQFIEVSSLMKHGFIIGGTLFIKFKMTRASAA